MAGPVSFTVTCPQCGQTFPVGEPVCFRYGEPLALLSCPRCQAHLGLSQDGQVQLLTAPPPAPRVPPHPLRLGDQQATARRVLDLTEDGFRERHLQVPVSLLALRVGVERGTLSAEQRAELARVTQLAFLSTRAPLPGEVPGRGLLFWGDDPTGRGLWQLFAHLKGQAQT
ncbi:zinc ribbon domain-containing protein [Deinococcus aluminii]|uniref:Zinc finger/thioredoxin putative domain-containing protein n=1 Tax=Deinococcus aluminii TaxID=1656885 RepID=A0ABP9XEV7_9DEIO